MPTKGFRLSGSVVQPTLSVTVVAGRRRARGAGERYGEAPDEAGGEHQDDEKDEA